MAERLGRDANVDFVGCIEQHVAAQKVEYGIEQQCAGGAGGEHIERCKALVNQHLVDNELEEDRKRQTERIKQNGGDRDVGEQSPLANQLGDEPAKSERLLRTGRGTISLDQDRVAEP